MALRMETSNLSQHLASFGVFESSAGGNIMYMTTSLKGHANLWVGALCVKSCNHKHFDRF